MTNLSIWSPVGLQVEHGELLITWVAILLIDAPPQLGPLMYQYLGRDLPLYSTFFPTLSVRPNTSVALGSFTNQEVRWVKSPGSPHSPFYGAR